MRSRIIALTVIAAATLAACSSSGTSLTSSGGKNQPSARKSPGPQITAPGKIAVHYHPKIVPGKFTSQVDNRYLPLVPGTKHLYKGTRDGVPTQTVVKVLRGTKRILGVGCVKVSDVVTQGGSLVEKTADWYAQDQAGNVWYFGESTAEYKNGVVTTTAGSWQAGVDKARPGIVMEARPKKGDHFRQEYRPAVALDKATILNTNATIKIPGGTYHGAVITHDINPLDPTKVEHKWYVRGIGFVHAILHQGGHTEVTTLVK